MSYMDGKKSYFINDFKSIKTDYNRKKIDISVILKRNKTEEKREEVQKICTMLGCAAGISIVFGMYFYF